MPTRLVECTACYFLTGLRPTPLPCDCPIHGAQGQLAKRSQEGDPVLGDVRAVQVSSVGEGTRRVGGLLGVAARLSGTVSPFRVEQGTSLVTPSRARASSCQESLPGSSVHGILQARILEWVATQCTCLNVNIFHCFNILTIAWAFGEPSSFCWWRVLPQCRWLLTEQGGDC